MNYPYTPSMHKIQIDILSKLITKRAQRFSELKPHDIENDQFNYHLQTLVKNEFVTKDNSTYSLSTSGTKLISNFHISGKPKNLFKVSVALFVFRNLGTREILVQKRLRHPFHGDITSISGKVEKGEALLEAARRKLKEESGLIADFAVIGTLRKIRRDTNNKLLEDTFYYICYAENPLGKLTQHNKFGENFWLKANEVIKTIKKNTDIGPYDIEIYKRLTKKNLTRFLFEQDNLVRSY